MRIAESHHPTEWVEKLPNGKLMCTLCPRACKLSDGQRGFCFVRKREGEKIVLTTYGRSSGFCIDPIEKKPLFHFLPGTPVLSFGTAGCNLACKFCQNWDISKAREFDRLQDAASPEDIARAAAHTGCTSVAFTYNDPVIFYEYALDTAHACHARGIKTVAVTAGYINPEPRRAFFAAMDAANIDLKAFTERFYKKLCGGQLAPVLDTLAYVHHETDCWLEITTLLIPGWNDSDNEIRKLARWVRDELADTVPLHFTAFHPDWRMTDVPPTPAATLARARRIAMDLGLKFVYTGNVHDPEGQTTYCPSCAKPLIVRDWYEILRYALDERGRCRHCGEPIPGRWGAHAGRWGAKRVPIRIQ